MNDEYLQAISFANDYFTLVDGRLAYDLEEHLAEDVSLNWFGKIVKGKRNVAAFMRINMTNSRHVFHEIVPAASIGGRKKRKKDESKNDQGKIDNTSESLIQSGLDFEKLRIKDASRGMEETIALDESTSFRREKNSVECLENLPANSSSQKADVDDSLIESVSKIECESSERDSSSDKSPINFVRANGIVHIYRSTGPNKIRKWRSSTFVSGLPGQTCRRHCELQVAYSCRNEETPRREKSIVRSRKVYGHAEKVTESRNCCTRSNVDEAKTTVTKGRKRLNSQEGENLETFVGLDLTFDPFENFDPFDDKQKFFKCLENGPKPQFNFSSPKYVRDRLVFDWTASNDSTNQHTPTSFQFNYLIHSLIYDSNTRSSLSEEFEDRKSLSDTEKSV